MKLSITEQENDKKSVQTKKSHKLNPCRTSIVNIQFNPALQKINLILMRHLTNEELNLIHEYNIKIYDSLNKNDISFKDLKAAQTLLNRSNKILIGGYEKLSLNESIEVDHLMEKQFKLFNFKNKYTQIIDQNNYL